MKIHFLTVFLFLSSSLIQVQSKNSISDPSLNFSVLFENIHVDSFKEQLKEQLNEGLIEKQEDSDDSDKDPTGCVNSRCWNIIGIVAAVVISFLILMMIFLSIDNSVQIFCCPCLYIKKLCLKFHSAEDEDSIV